MIYCSMWFSFVKLLCILYLVIKDVLLNWLIKIINLLIELQDIQLLYVGIQKLIELFLDQDK